LVDPRDPALARGSAESPATGDCRKRAATDMRKREKPRQRLAPS